MDALNPAPINHMRCSLRLVYPPVSNQEAEWLKRDPEVAKIIQDSSLYMIAARKEIRFHDFSIDDMTPSSVIVDGDVCTINAECRGSVLLRFKISAGEDLSDDVAIDIEELIRQAFSEGDLPVDYLLELGDKFVKIIYVMDPPSGTNSETWFSTEKMILDRSKGHPWIRGFDKFRDFATYELLYVGISTAMGTFNRLFKKAHHARQSILSNEYPRTPGSRVSDEVYLFPFRVEPIIFRTVDNDFDPDSYADKWDSYYDSVVADAEKAFIHTMDPGYNDQKYKSYPEGKDGLYGQHDKYVFLLDESLTFTTKSLTFRGANVPGLGIGGGDAIVISGDSVKILPAEFP